MKLETGNWKPGRMPRVVANTLEDLWPRLREGYPRLVGPVVEVLAKLGVTPNMVSITGVMISLGAGLLLASGWFFAGAIVTVIGATCDILDGQLARGKSQATAFGAFLDSTLDRVGELFTFMGLAWYFSGGHPPLGTGPAGSPSPWAVAFILLAVAGSFMVSYTRARAEGLGVECKTGVMQRPERVVLLIAGTVLAPVPVIGLFVLKTVLLALALTSGATAIQRILHVRRELAGQGR